MGLLCCVGVFWGGCKKEKKADDSQGANKAAGRSTPPVKEALRSKAEKAFERKRYSRAVKFAFRGYLRWLRRSGGRAGRIDAYRRVLFAVMDRGAEAVVLHRCARAQTAFEDRACEQIFLQYWRRGAVEPAARGDAARLYRTICLTKKDVLERFVDACKKLPARLAAKPPLRAMLEHHMRRQCNSRSLSKGQQAVCKRMVLVFWRAARRGGKVDRFAVLAPLLVRMGGVEGWRQVLTLLAADGTAAPKRAVLERVLLQHVGARHGVILATEAFLQRLEKAQRNALIKRYTAVVRDHIPETASILAQAGMRSGRAVIDALKNSGVAEWKRLAAKLRQRVASKPLNVLHDYLSLGRERVDLRERALRLLTRHPDLFFQHVLFPLSRAPLPQRQRYRRLVARLRPKALYGGVEGRLVRSSSRMSAARICRLQLVELSSCDGPNRIGPNERGRARGKGRGKPVRCVRTALTHGDLRYRFEKVPAGPYEMFVRCGDHHRWQRIRFGGFEKRKRPDGGQAWIFRSRCLVVVQPLKTTRAVPVFIDRPWRFRRPPRGNPPARRAGGRAGKTADRPVFRPLPKRAAPVR